MVYIIYNVYIFTIYFSLDCVIKIYSEINKLYSQQEFPTKCMRSFPPIGAIFVTSYEVYFVIYDVLNGTKCIILGTGLVETKQ